MPSESPAIEPLAPGSDRRWLAVAMALVFALRVVLLLNTEVTAPDSVGFIRYALDFEARPWGEVVRGHHQHPAYPFLIRLMSLPVRAVAGGVTPESMRWSAQLVSLFASLLLVFPTYRLGSLLGHRAYGFGGAVLFQFLPVVSHNLSDGLTEATYLFFLASGLWMIVSASCFGGAWRWGLAGVFGGLAYLTRPEGAEVVIAATGMIVLGQLVRPWRRSWGEAGASLAALLLAAFVVGFPFCWAIGGFSNKPSTLVIDTPSLSELTPAGSGVHGLWAVNISRTSRGVDLLARTLFAILSEIDKNLFHHAWFGVAIGLFWLGGAYLRSRAGLAIVGFAAMHMVVLVLLGMKHRYIADRHVLPIVMLLCPLAVAGMAYFCARMQFRVGRVNTVEPKGFRALRLTFIVMGVLVLFGIPKAVQSLHGGRHANRIAGEWLADQIKPEDDIVDSHGIASLYAKVLATHRSKGEPRFLLELPAKLKHPTWVVVTRDRDGWIYDIRPRQEKDLVEKRNGVLEYHWPVDRPESEAKVVIYRVDPK